MLVLPNSMGTITGLSATERDWLAWNFASDQGQRDNKNELTGFQAFKMAAVDPKTYLLMGTLHMVRVPHTGGVLGETDTTYNRRMSRLL